MVMFLGRNCDLSILVHLLDQLHIRLEEILESRHLENALFMPDSLRRPSRGHFTRVVAR